MELGTMGKYVQTYRPNVLSLHRTVNDLFALPSVQAFPQSVIVQQKQIPDVSFYQGDIVWNLMRQKTDAIIIRAGQNQWVDIRFKDNWPLAKRHGLLRGSYWFYDDRVSPGKQAELWTELLHWDLPEMEIWVDWENSYGGSYGGLKNVVSMMEAMERNIPGIDVGMYTGYWWFREHSNAVTNVAQYEYLKRHKLFEAFYTANAASVLVPQPWSEMYLWQFGTPAVGLEYGVATKEIDMSYINMTEEEFERTYRGVVVPPPTGEEIMQGRIFRLTNMRAQNTQYSTDLGDFLAGDIVTWTEQQPGNDGLVYNRITNATRNGQPVRRSDGKTVQEANVWAWAANIEQLPPSSEEPTITLTHTIETYSDGSIRIDGKPYP